MALLKIEDFDPNYRDTFGGNDLQGMSVYTEGSNEEKFGNVTDVLVDEEGHLRYLVVDLGFWIFGKKVLLPIGRSRIDYNSDRVYVSGMTREQAEALPEYSDRMTTDYDYEEQVRGVYRSPAMGASVSPVADATYDRSTYNYQQEPSLYEINDRDHQTLKLYQERLIANKTRVKTGEVTVGKHIETETARVSVPIEKERVVIERVTPADAGQAVAPGTVSFQEGEVARMEIYEETPDIHKEAFVREEVRVSKVVDRETVDAEETIRREELDVNTTDQTFVDRSTNLPTDRI
ncbi:DUF2382 domain-containing protein [Funiculus sociatus GB2-A5]|uniref:DUF2382 domain-containing protein n=1 Tax=Funiculus sociatus GB2-A5 TaxID=2933946 RepID=A0ABV0JVI5_9CYAN|nr:MULTISPECIES: DUF2382 domain-containing protein [unclassified Trichocoleus]MBD1904590.1 DUF2382 domain-containing protein [Trichocoleus sp. FACHB-832]MBD2060962.1 DUF2382 domain-containing protein [Trichocoleus sp. FACHB-6]